MLYQVSLTIPANTPKTDPASKTIRIHEPVLYRIGAHFPPGCCHLPYVAIYYGHVQLWPSREGEWVSGDNVTIWDDPYLEFKDYPYELILKGYNEDTAFSHTITFYLCALERPLALWALALARLAYMFERFFDLIGIPIVPVIRRRG